MNRFFALRSKLFEMTAFAAGNDPAVRAHYRVTHIITAGSPTADLPHPPGARVLALENTRDLVPQLDGAAAPDRPDHLTVRFVGRPDATGFAAHEPSRYTQEGARRVDAVADAARTGDDASDGARSVQAYGGGR